MLKNAFLEPIAQLPPWLVAPPILSFIKHTKAGTSSTESEDRLAFLVNLLYHITKAASQEDRHNIRDALTLENLTPFVETNEQLDMAVCRLSHRVYMLNNPQEKEVDVQIAGSWRRVEETGG